jgi:amino acid transporter
MNEPTHLDRRIGLRSAVALNMLDMIGVGPFFTVPLIIAAAGTGLSIWAWVLGAFIAIADGLVWAELGAAFPHAGGSYAFLRSIYGRERWGKWLSFLFVWQVTFTAPFSMVSGCLGFSSFLAWFWPALNGAPIAALPWIHYTNLTASLVVMLVTALLYRKLGSTTKLAWFLFCGVLTAILGVIASGIVTGARIGFVHAASLVSYQNASFASLAHGTLLATYCYWGYYNICFLGGEVRHPTRNIPRAILISVVIVATLYVLMNIAVLPALTQMAVANSTLESQLSLVAQIANHAFGPIAGTLLAVMIMWTAFSSIFSLSLGYSRVPYAAAQDGNYFQSLAVLHPKLHIPHRSLLMLCSVAAVACYFPLTTVITLLVVTRILLQFIPQQIGVMLLRFQQPELARPYKMPLFPLPPLIALTGFAFLLSERENALRATLVTAAIAVSGTILFLWRARRQGEWPFAN